MRPAAGREPSSRLRAATSASLTYPQVGATTGALPAGYRHVHRSAVLGTGAEVFDAAVGQLLSWGMHRRAGFDVEATSTSPVVGTTVLLRAGVGPFRLVAPCRVVLVVEEPRRKGFAYGTLRGHPEIGEELFVLTIDDHGQVRVRITAFSRPGTWWARLGEPVNRRVQDRITDRYVAALEPSP